MPLDKVQAAEVKQVYELFDTTGAGAVPASELGVLLRSVGEAPTERMVADLIGEATTLTLDDVLRAVDRCRAECPRPSLAELEAAFKTLDQSGTGAIEIGELRRFLTTLGEPLSTEEFEDVLKHVQVRDDGKVDCAKMAKMLAS